MSYLVRVARTPPIGVGCVYTRTGMIQVVNPQHVDHEHLMPDMCDFLMVDERDLERVTSVLAEANPGKEVQVYVLKEVSVCPAAALVRKQVTADGILPS